MMIFQFLKRPAAIAAAAITATGGAVAQVEFTKSDIYFELNATDGDAGLHGILDGDAWQSARIKGPGGAFDVIRAFSNMDSPEFGMTELFFESNEPPLDERSFRELTALFPPGTYDFVGVTTGNQSLNGSDVLSTAMPCPPKVRVSRQADGDVVIAWRRLKGVYDPDSGVCDKTVSVPAASIQAYFIIEDPATGASRNFSADLPPTASSIEVPDEFLSGVDFSTVDSKAEVIIVAPDGNRTAIEIETEF